MVGSEDAGEDWAETTGLAPAGAGEAVSELTYAGMAALFRLLGDCEAADGDGDGACLALTRLLLPGFATISTSIHVVYISALPLGRLGSTPGSVGQLHSQYIVKGLPVSISVGRAILFWHHRSAPMS